MHSASTRFGRHCASNSRRRMPSLHAPGNGQDGVTFWAVLADPARPRPDKAAPAFKNAIAAPRPAPLRAGVLG